MPTMLIQCETRMFTRHSRIQQDDIIIECTPNSSLTARNHMHQPFFWQPARWISVLGVRYCVRRRTDSHDPQHTIVLTHAVYIPGTSGRFYFKPILSSNSLATLYGSRFLILISSTSFCHSSSDT